ncbi:MAG: hypothetical protein LQ338_007471 [Usnochroma carphineum]|nr:MAG: hypothetical protein LQ338_007471 [Usnochroma carphineum]
MAPPTLQPYNAVTFTNYLTQIYDLINVFDRITKHATPCEICMLDVLHEVKSHLEFLLTMGPSQDIEEELVDMNRLTKLSRDLLDVDDLGITPAVWTLVERKLNSLQDSSLAAPPSYNKDPLLEQAAVEGILKTQRRSDANTLDLSVPSQSNRRQTQQPGGSNFGFDVVERAQKQEQPGQSTESGFDFDVVERAPERQQQPARSGGANFNFDVVERAPKPQQSAQSTGSGFDYDVVERVPKPQQLAQPKESGFDFDIIERVPDRQQPARSTGSGLDFDIVERAPERQQPASAPPKVDPDAIKRMLGSLRGIITSLEKDSKDGEGPTLLQDAGGAQLDI